MYISQSHRPRVTDLDAARKSEFEVNQLLDAIKLNYLSPHKPTITVVSEHQGAEHLTRQQERLANRQRRDIDLDVVEVTLVAGVPPFATMRLDSARNAFQ